jgi:hypothetical protein
LQRYRWFSSRARASRALFAGPLLGQIALPSVEIECNALSREQVAEVEARARADLMTTGVSVLHAELTCSFDRVTAMVASEETSVVHTAESEYDNLRDALIDALDAALLRLMESALASPSLPVPAAQGRSTPPRESPVEERPPAPSVPSNGASPASGPLLFIPVASEEPRRDATTSPKSPRRPTLDASAAAALEFWQPLTAVGASLETSYGTSALALGVRFGALTAVPSADAFGALELSAGGAVRWQPPWSYGIRLSATLGASWLDVTPRAPYRPSGATRVAAGFAHLELSRPLRFGDFALVPAAGLRLFAAERSVNLDGRAELVIGHAAPGLAVGLAHAFD